MAIGSITKEFPFEQVVATLNGIRPGMTYGELREFAARHTHRDIPGAIRNRWLLINQRQVIQYDLLLSTANADGFDSAKVRKIMYFLFAMRDVRILRFIKEKIADRQGHWRVSALKNKSNADFFLNWFEENPSKKARSNFERFLVEIGILDGDQIDLDLADGWLPVALAVAAQYENNAQRRKEMTTTPAEYLIKNQLNFLANASPEELRGGVTVTTVGLDDPLEDDSIPSEAPTSRGTVWHRRRPRASDRQSTQATIDLVARERANGAHWELESLLAEAIRTAGHEPKFNSNVDMFFTVDVDGLLAEMKSCHRRNLHSQVRKGISQLLEYRYRYREQLGENLTLLLVLETRPADDQEWLLDYVESLGIVVAWKDEGRLATPSAVPAILHQIIHAV